MAHNGVMGSLHAGKVAIAVFALSLLGAPPIYAQVSEAALLFDTANQQYAEGTFQDALTSYASALGQGYTSGALLYNMGNAYYRLDQWGQALRHYEKARKLLGEDPHLVHNIEMVRAQIGRPFSALPTPFWAVWWKRVPVRQGPIFFFAPGILLYIVAAMLYGYHIWARDHSAWRRRARAAALALGLALMATAFGASLDGVVDRQAVIVTESAAFSEAPDGPATLQVPEGVLVDLLGSEADQAAVRLPNGVRGYVASEALGEI